MLGAGLALAACGRRRDPDRLSLWAIDAEGENAKYVLPAFTRATGLPVDLQWLAWTAAHEKLLTAYVGGSLPDVFMVSRAWVSEFATIGAAGPAPAALLDDSYQARAIDVGGRSYAVPWTLDFAVQYFRRDLLARAGYDAPPQELDAWRAMLRGVQRRQRDGYAVLMQLDWPDHLLHIAEQQPEPLLRDRQSRGNFSSPGFRWALAFYASLFAEGLAPRVSSLEAFDPANDLARGWIAVYAAGAWNRAELIRRRGLLPRSGWGTAPMPGLHGPGVTKVAGAVLCVSPRAADPAAAWALVRHLTSTPSAMTLLHASGLLPARPSAWAEMPPDPAFAAFRDALTRPVPGYNLVEWERITREIQLVAEQVVRRGLSIDAAVAEMDRRADALLAKRRWMLERGRIA